MTDLIKRAHDWAAAHGIPFSAGATRFHEPPPGGLEADFEHDLEIDFGGMVRRRPAFALSPRTIDAVQETVRFLNSESVPYKLRGAAHSPSGEVLSDGGAVIDLRGLCEIKGSDPRTEVVCVEGGALWLSLIESLSLIGRAPLVLTDNPRTTIAGTLSYGGFGDSSHLHGLQIDSVVSATMVLPNGERRELQPSDDLLRYALAGHGQLGILVEITLRTWRRPWRAEGRLLHFDDPRAFIDASMRFTEERRFDYVRARAGFSQQHAVTALVGCYGDVAPLEDLEPLKPSAQSAIEPIDLRGWLTAWQRRDPIAEWPRFAPALEVVLPLPEGLALWPRFADVANTLGPSRLPRGYSVQVLPRHDTRRLPLAPMPDTAWALLLALRPEANTHEDARRTEEQLVPLARRAIECGGRVYLSSFKLPADLVIAQYQDKLSRLATFKRAVDPQNLCNPGALFGYDL